MIYQHRGHSYAIGMAWSDFVDQGQARVHLKAARRPYLLVDVAADPSGTEGVALGTAAEHRLPRYTVSAAMAIGRLFPEAVIRQSLPDGTVWVARVTAGAPCSGRDEVLAAGEAGTRLLEEGLQGATLIGDLDGAVTTVDDALSLYEDHVADRRIGKEQERALRLRRAPSPAAPLATAAVLFLVIAGIGGGLWLRRDQLRDAQARRELLERITVSREQSMKREAERQRQREAFADAVATRRRALVEAQEDPAVQWRRWDSVRRALPLSLNGYVPESMECSRSDCTVQWRPSGPRVTQVDRAAIPGWIDDGPANPMPRSRVSLAPDLQARTTLRTAADAAALHWGLVQALQREEGAASVAMGRPEVVQAPEGTDIAAVTVGTTGELRLAVSGGAALMRAHDAIRSLAGFPVRLERLRWSQLAVQPALVVDARWIHVSQ